MSENNFFTFNEIFNECIIKDNNILNVLKYICNVYNYINKNNKNNLFEKINNNECKFELMNEKIYNYDNTLIINNNYNNYRKNYNMKYFNLRIKKKDICYDNSNIIHKTTRTLKVIFNNKFIIKYYYVFYNHDISYSNIYVLSIYKILSNNIIYNYITEKVIDITDNIIDYIIINIFIEKFYLNNNSNYNIKKNKLNNIKLHYLKDNVNKNINYYINNLIYKEIYHFYNSKLYSIFRINKYKDIVRSSIQIRYYNYKIYNILIEKYYITYYKNIYTSKNTIYLRINSKIKYII